MNKKNEEPCTPVLKKRGRKSKKELEEIALQKASTDNINVLIEESNTESEINVNTITDLLNSDDENDGENNVESNLNLSQKCEDGKPVAKKRGENLRVVKLFNKLYLLVITKSLNQMLFYI